MAASFVFSGARAIVKMNQVQVGFAGGVSGSESIEYEPIDVLDLLEVKEFVPVAYRCTLSAQIFRVIGESLKAAGVFPTVDNIITADDLTLAIEDKVTRETMAQFERCKISEVSWDVTARGIVSQNVTFVTIRVKDESQLPSGG